MSTEKADFTVTMKRNESGRKIKYGADALYTSYMGGGDGGRVPALPFLCSGEPTTVPADQVESIELSVGKMVCMVCES